MRACACHDRDMFVLTADQVGSRRGPDAVPQLASAHLADRAVLPFSRTAGDEAQAVFDDAEAAVECALGLVMGGSWHCGLGQGSVEIPLPDDAREGRGTAFVNARRAVTDAKKAGAHHVGFVSDSPLGEGVRAGLRVLVTAWDKQRGTTREAYGLAADGNKQTEIAAALGISQQAVSDRLSAGMYRELQDLRREMIRWAEYLDGLSSGRGRERR